MSTDTGAGDLHPDIKKKVPYKGNVTRFEGDPTSKAAATAQKAHTKAMDAAFKPSEEEGAPLKNTPPPTNRRGSTENETPGGKATNPLDRPTAGKFTPRQVAAKIAAMRGKS